ncbi:MAG: N-6 DNA methylase, partial [Acidobacteria bacterium]|nr:N-6 DNA methylase [Acidobacteriota bacterium]
NYLSAIEHYYKTIRDEASRIADHTEKQKFLKVIYEEFYKVYNPKGADRLGVVYTPNEIVRFMIESTDHLLEKHFGRNLQDENVEILDPATGTGTFITDLIDYIAPQYLEHKYKNEIHANEVAILPYYIANLNIEFTYQQKMGKYEEFENICFVDTLDNLGFKSDDEQFKDKYAHQQDLFGAISSENAKRIKEQNERKISVVIGNPPYNAKQENYNYQNSNRAYQTIDNQIKDTYIRHGTAQNQIAIYDMYVRFFRWASTRINEDGIIAFVSNNSFLDSQSYDGFRKVVGDEFNEVWIVNLKGNARTSGERRRKEKGNIFSDKIRVGVAVYFFIKNSKKMGFSVYYNEIEDYKTSKEKKDYLADNRIENLRFEHLIPSKRNDWINQSDNDFEELMCLIDKGVKTGKSEEAIFKMFSRGIATQRDEWVYDFASGNLEEKIKYFVDIYQETIADERFHKKMNIKWDRELDKYRARKIGKEYSQKQIQKSLYRPYVSKYLYFDKNFNGMTYQWFDIYRESEPDKYIAYNALGNKKNFHLLASDRILDLHVTGDAQCLPFYTYDSNGERRENITDWALEKFQKHYHQESIYDHPEKEYLEDEKGNLLKDQREKAIAANKANSTIDPNLERWKKLNLITKEKIFHYVYAVLHNPVYRKKYELNLKRDFPRIPFYKNFSIWADWGKSLMDLHINYETVEEFGLERKDAEMGRGGDAGTAIKPKLTADREAGIIYVDSQTTLYGVPEIAWEYKLGNRSALEWILDQYKEKKPRDETIREKFNNYLFADHKEHVIELLQRVCTVSVKTMEIVKLMEIETEHWKDQLRG